LQFILKELVVYCKTQKPGINQYIMINEEVDLNSRPPKFKSWKDIYILVLLNLGILIALFFWLTISLK